MQTEAFLWVDIVDQEASCIARQTCRFRSLIGSLKSPYDQRPSFVLFLDLSKSKYFPEGERSGVHLRCDSVGIKSREPLLIASTQHLLSHPLWRSAHWRKLESGDIVQETALRKDQSLSVLPGMLFPFTDVLCFTGSHQSDIAAIESQINLWFRASKEAVTTLPMPGIVVLLTGAHDMQPVEVERQLAQKFPTLQNTG